MVCENNTPSSCSVNILNIYIILIFLFLYIAQLILNKTTFYGILRF